MVFSSSVVCFVFCVAGLIVDSRARSLSLSVNLSIKLNDGSSSKTSKYTSALLQTCVKEIETHFNDMNRPLLNSPEAESAGDATDAADTADAAVDPQDSNEKEQGSGVDYENSFASNIVEERNDEAFKCFKHCLYDKLGLIKDGVIIDTDYFREIYSTFAREKLLAVACSNTESKKYCEDAYRLHLCYTKLRNLEAERRIREILEANGNNRDGYEYNDSTNQNTTDSEVSDVEGGETEEKDIENNEIN